MILKSAKISNFKSIGKENNVLYVEDTVTALIGKNESGKSNVLESLGLLDLLKPLDSGYINKRTNGQSDDPTVSLIFAFSEKDKETFKKANDTTTIQYDKACVLIEGGLSHLIEQDDDLTECVIKLKFLTENNALKLDSDKISAIKKTISKLFSLSKNIYYSIFSELNQTKRFIQISTAEEKYEYLESVDRITEIIERYYDMIPQIYYRKSDNLLKDSYTYDEIQKIYNDNRSLPTSNDVLFNLMKAANVDENTVVKSFEVSGDSAKHTFTKAIDAKIKTFVSQFNNFYGQEKIEADFNISGKTARLYISTSDIYMSFSERSNGLKWYFSLFIDIKAKTSVNRPTIFLLDEPGVYLHVRAQKKLLELFNNLSEKGNQIIYTTHSPFMIDPNNVFNIRAIEKNDVGISNIFKSVYNSKLSNNSKMETLSPLIEALGMDLKDNIGPQYSKKNIIVEGITDCLYISAMLQALGVSEDKKPNIIPCAGVDNVNRVVSVLIGWGCEYRVVLDYDSQGFRQYKLLVLDTGLADQSLVYFVNLKTATKSSDINSSNSETTESLIASDDNSKLDTKYDGTDKTKTLAAKDFHDKVISGHLIPEQSTRDNFKKLFEALGIEV